MTINLGKRFFETFIYFLSSLFFTLFCFFSFSLVSGFMTKNQIIFEVLMLVIFSTLNMAIILTLYREKVTSLGFSRVLLFYVIFLIVVAFGIKKISYSNIAAVSFVPFVLINYFYFVYNYKSLNLYHNFEEQCVGLSKKELKEKLYHNNTIALDYSQSIKSSIVSQLIFAILCILIFIAEKNIYHQNSFTVGITLVLHLICVFLMFIFFCTNKNEVFYAFLGFDNIFKYRKKIVKASFIICLISIVFSLFISSDSAILNYKFILAILKKIFVVESPIIQKTDIKSFNEPEFPPLILEPSLYDENNNYIFELIGIIIQLFFALLVVFLILMFLFKPLFNEKFINFIKNNKLKLYFKNFFNTLKKIIKSIFFGSSIELQKYTTVESKSFYDNISEFLKKSKKSKAKKEELDRFTKKYMKLVDWAKSKEITYKKTYGPLEFCKMINVDSAVKAGEIFEKALYSFELVSEAEEIEFNKLIEETIK